MRENFDANRESKPEVVQRREDGFWDMRPAGEAPEPSSYGMQAEEVPAPRPTGLWSTLKRLVAPVVAVFVVLFKFGAQLKFLLLLLPKVKFLGTAVTMLISVGAYALMFPLWFAVGLVIMMLVHEMGHVFQLRREGIKATAPMFIPFLGAMVGMKELPPDAAAEARVGLAGPVVGTLGALAAWGIYVLTEQPVFLGIAYVGFLLNLFNLLPTLPLDGGRAVGALSPTFWILGLAGAAAFVVFNGNPIILLVLIFGGIEIWHRWKNRHSEESKRYHNVSPGQRLAIGAVYFGLAALLALFMSVTYVADPTTLSSGLI